MEYTFSGTASSAASAASDAAYPDTPPIRNEMINRNRLTAQGSTALNRLMHLMIANGDQEMLGLDGWKPEGAPSTRRSYASTTSTGGWGAGTGSRCRVTVHSARPGMRR